MRLVFFILFFTISLPLICENLYILQKLDEAVYIGKILEDDPGVAVVIELNSGEVLAIPYSEIDYIRLYIEAPFVHEDDPVPPAEIEPEEQPQVELPTVISEDPVTSEVPQGYSYNDLSSRLKDLSIYSLNGIELEQGTLVVTDNKTREKIYSENRKDDHIKFTLLNIVPGLGSILQGDYYSGVYTLTSVLGALAYNLADTGGTDIYIVVNLNGAVAYLSSFFAPYRYNSKYNNILKDKLDIAD